jgi:hypothetical protein
VLVPAPPLRPSDTIRILLTEGVDPTRAPHPSNEAEAIVFGHVHQTLVRRDCRGGLRAGLADGWTGADDGRRWRFHLRAPIAGPVAATLTTAAPAGWGIDADGDRELVVTTPRRTAAPPAELGAVPLAVPLVLSSGPDGVETSGATGAVLAFRWRPQADARDGLEGDADVVLTDQPAALEYARARRDWLVVALPWSRTYVVVRPAPAPGETALAGSLDHAAVRTDTRSPEPPFWWEEVRCGAEPRARPPGPPASPSSGRVVYRTDDRHARALAERLVAIAPPAHGLRATGLPATAVAAAVAAGVDAAVLALPRAPADPCATLVAAGLAGRRGDVVPLVETRLHLVVRRGRTGVSLSGDGTPRFDP